MSVAHADMLAGSVLILEKVFLSSLLIFGTEVAGMAAGHSSGNKISDFYAKVPPRWYPLPGQEMQILKTCSFTKTTGSIRGSMQRVDISWISLLY